MIPRSRMPGAVTLLTTLGAAALLLGPDPLSAAGDKDKDKDKKAITVTDKDNDKEIKAAKGDTLAVKLPMTAGTGFTWTINRYDKDKLETDGKMKVERDGDKKVVGGPQTAVFTFTAKAAGKAELELKYSRPFEKDKAPAKTFKVTVLIE
jgi:inhibitor of cysteine peptidase